MILLNISMDYVIDLSLGQLWFEEKHIAGCRDSEKMTLDVSVKVVCIDVKELYVQLKKKDHKYNCTVCTDKLDMCSQYQ